MYQLSCGIDFFLSVLYIYILKPLSKLLLSFNSTLCSCYHHHQHANCVIWHMVVVIEDLPPAAAVCVDMPMNISTL